jgi:hypothetical protein
MVVFNKELPCCNNKTNIQLQQERDGGEWSYCGTRAISTLQVLIVLLECLSSPGNGILFPKTRPLCPRVCACVCFLLTFTRLLLASLRHLDIVFFSFLKIHAFR